MHTLSAVFTPTDSAVVPMGKTRKTITIDSELADLVDDRASFNLSGFVNDCLEQHFAGDGIGSPQTAALKAELERIESELNDVEQKKQSLRQQRERIEEELAEQVDQEPELMDQAITQLEGTERDPSNIAIQNWASKLGTTPEELCDRLPERTPDTGGNYL